MNELIKIEEKELLDYFTNGGLDPVLREIEKLAKNFEADVTTSKGRSEITAQATKVQKCRTYIESLKLSLTSEWKKKSKAVDAEGKTAKDFLIDLQKQIRKPLTDWEDMDKERIKRISERIITLREYLTVPATDSQGLKLNLKALSEIEVDDSMDEFKDEADHIKKEATELYKAAIASQEKYEEEQEELECLRREKAEREKKEHDEIIAKEAAESAKKQAEAVALKEKEKIENEKKEAIEREEMAKQEKINAEKRAIEIEKQAKIDKENAVKEKQRAVEQARIDEQKRLDTIRINAEAEAKKREDDISHRKKINNEAVDCLTSLITDREKCQEIVKLIASGKVSNIKIFY